MPKKRSKVKPPSVAEMRERVSEPDARFRTYRGGSNFTYGRFIGFDSAGNAQIVVANSNVRVKTSDAVEVLRDGTRTVWVPLTDQII